MTDKFEPFRSTAVASQGEEAPLVKPYRMPEIKNPGVLGGEKIKELKHLTKDHPKDLRFNIHPLLRDPLSIEEEENRLIGERVRDQVQAISSEARAQAREEGFREGLALGKEEASRKILEEGKIKLEHFETLLREMESLSSEIFSANERLFVEMVFRIGKMLALKEIQADPEYLLRLSKELILRVGAKDNVTIRISPEDHQTIEQLKEGLKKSFGPMNNLTVEVSSEVTGGCLLETEWNSIDSRLETQIQGLYESLFGKSS